MRSKAILSVLICLALLLSFGIAVKEAKADAILFPYIGANTTLATVVSVVAGKADLVSNKLHMEYWYKNTTAIGNTEACAKVDFDIDSSKNDIVSFEVNGTFGGTTGGPLFNDPKSNVKYTNNNFTMGVTNPRRAFLIIDDKTDNTYSNLYGEAMIMDISSGAAWGYRAYNPVVSTDGDSATTAAFGNEYEKMNEVLAGTDYAPVTLLPWDGTSKWKTRFFVTPISPTGTQRNGKLNAAIRLVDLSGANNLYPYQTSASTPTITEQIYDRDEVVVSGIVKNEIVCVGGVDLEDLLSEGAKTRLKGQGGWGYVDIEAGSVTTTALSGVISTSEAIVFKLEYNTNNYVDSTSFTGTVNSAVWLHGNAY